MSEHLTILHLLRKGRLARRERIVDSAARIDPHSSLGMIKREFLDWTRTPLAAVVEWLEREYGQPAGGVPHSAARAAQLPHDQPSRTLDLSGVILVTPGGRAARRLAELLLQEAETSQTVYFPPTITTVGQLPEMLYPLQRPLANSFTQQLAWVAALRSQERTALGNLMASLPDGDSPARWLALSKLLAQQHRELAADQLDFDDVVRVGNEFEDFQEHDRWEVLARVRAKYLATLDELGLWDRQTARLVAIDLRECRTEHQIVLVGTVDMNQATRAMLDLVADRVTALVFAPPSVADQFDEHGCLLPEAWQEAEIPVERSHLFRVENVMQQGTAAVWCLHELPSTLTTGEITIGIPEEPLVASIQGSLEAAGVSARFGPGEALTSSPLYRALAAISDYLGQHEPSALASSVRHPDVFDWLNSRPEVTEGWLSELDIFLATRLPITLTSDDVPAGKREFAGLRAVLLAIEAWLAPLGPPKRKLADWCAPIAEVITTLTADRSYDRHSALARSLQELQSILQELTEVPAALQPEFMAHEVLSMVLDQLRAGRVPAEPDPQAIELLGWLELPLDDAPALIVTSLNEGIVPQATNADLFLPDRLRGRLGLEDNRRRYARDAYFLTLLIHSRAHLRLLVPQMNAEGDPRLPSRLLLATELRDLPERCELLFSEEDDLPRGTAPLSDTPPLPMSLAPQVGEADLEVRRPFRIPRPQPLLEPISYLRITDFAVYLRCPYEFYLGRVVRLSELDDQQMEMDGLGFGNLAHEVMRRFGLSKHVNLTSADRLARAFDQLLEEAAEELLAKSYLPAVRVQLMQLRQRLKAFARKQAEHRAEGWEIRHVEVPIAGSRIFWQVDGKPIELRGRIDRIDYHPDLDAWQVLDYKTGEKQGSPEKQHRTKDGVWQDLQLPLYRHVCTAIGITGPLQFGYALLCKKLSDIGFSIAQWSDDDLAQADRAAEEIVRAIWKERFWPPQANSAGGRAGKQLSWSPRDGILLRGTL